MTAPANTAEMDKSNLHNTAILNSLNGMVENTSPGHAAYAIIDGRMVIAVRHESEVRSFSWFLDGRPVDRADLIEFFKITHRDGSPITQLGATP